MRSILKCYNITNKKVWVCDSFEGLPPPECPEDINMTLHLEKFLSVSLEEVMENFCRYDLLDDQVIFVKGYFKNTLTNLPADKFSVIRLDGDMYKSTTDALTYLYPIYIPNFQLWVIL